MSPQISTKIVKFVVGYFLSDAKHMHLTKTFCYDLGNRKKKKQQNIKHSIYKLFEMYSGI